jgi:signal transduction histidine kinase
MFFLHFAFYFFYQRQKVNLHYGLFSLFSALAFILYTLLVHTIHDVWLNNFFKIPALILFPLSSWFSIEAFYAWYGYKKNTVYWVFFALLFFAIAACFNPFNAGGKWIAYFPFFYFPLMVNLECLRISIETFRSKKKPAINAVAPFVTVFIVAMMATLISIQIKSDDTGYLFLIFDFLITIALLSLPVGIFKYTASELRYYNHQLERARALKNKIELDLHDDLGSKLSTLRLFLKRIKIQRADANSVLLDNSLHLLDTSISDLRQMMNELQTSILVEKGYIIATEELINKINYLQEISFILTHNGFSRRFDQKTEYNLFRITQELINNTLKYANAKVVTLNMVSRDDKIIFMYEDDGAGFDVNCERK